MTHGKDKKKTTIQSGKQRHESVGEGDKRKLVSFSSGLKLISADRSSVRGSDDIYELPTLYILSVQRYEGDTCDGQFHGGGVACFEGGHVYKGMFCKGLMDGRGVFTWAGGLKYEGDFVCNAPMGQGTYTWPDGSSYNGELCNGLRHGTGIFTCANNNVTYRGQWDQGKRHGEGTVYYNQDKTSWYKGSWVKNNREGWGERHYPSGNIYTGEWKNNLRHGEGTMKWIKLGEQYVGAWQNGLQHGRGAHIWILQRAHGSQYTQSNEYTGHFVQGKRHGCGTFYYAGGAIYEGEWSNNKKHGKAKFTFKDGHVFHGEFVDDHMMTGKPKGNRAATPLSGASPRRSGSDPSTVGPDMALNIERLLDKIPVRNHDAEHKQVGFVALRQYPELRAIYSFYSRLGHAHSPDNTFLLSRLQLWRLLKDCSIHLHGTTLTQIDLVISENASAVEIHSPFTPLLFCGFVNCLVSVAFHVYHKDLISEKNLLAACFSKLLADNILPNAMNVKGFLFRHQDRAFEAVKHLQKCWEIYQVYCRVSAAPRSDKTMTCRQLLWMFKELHLLDESLTTARLLEVITVENLDPSNWSSGLDVEIVFLEFFEVLLGSAEVKCPHTEARKDLSMMEPEKSSDTAELPITQNLEGELDVEANISDKHQSAEIHSDKAKGVLDKGSELEVWIQSINQFFIHFLYPAFEHNQLVFRKMKEKLPQEGQQGAR